MMRQRQCTIETEKQNGTIAKSRFTKPYGSIERHLHLMRSGEIVRDGKFSLLVALSSLLFLFVAIPHVQTHSYYWAALWGVVSLCSLLADSLMTQNKFINTADRVVATLVFFAYPIRIIFWPGPASWDFRLAISTLAVLSLCVLQWARSSKQHSEFVVRQSLWHLVGTLSLYYTAHKFSHGHLHNWYALY